MLALRRTLTIFLVGLWVTVGNPSESFAQQALSTGVKVMLQATMQRHIESVLVGGVYPQINLKTGEVRRLHPATAHPMIVQVKDVYVLCTDFRDEQGRKVNLDFYIAKKGAHHVVFQTIVGNRDPLKKLIKSGVAQVTN
ncbi:MAG: hypothetical protein O3A84_02945 [Proteobacteria bacterium]|nr:hypothetical protein [Pseudomonadota bacterium]